MNTGVKLSKRCDSIEELAVAIDSLSDIKFFGVDRWSDHFTLSYYLPEIKEKWNGRCCCGHLHSEHHPSSSVNYSAGHCTVGECRCKNFLHDKQNDKM